ncbi:MAG: hypothetical protein UT15_C0004G0005 [Berkelbacteria bacterium GW2011_GWA1_39_10]|uniref:Uncharacterized protein n=1 Tax=Berkelbacteria bacterium GW2011_GWA1_39_10 TaxID=1618332 RepID=A0A0G0LI87_9BACT|nr:MAG: hypothetical protein UT15_C0004G0005 [Berkelbacteria bacterium GW2011_GWA1_39_10]
MYDPEAKIGVLAHIAPNVIMVSKMQERTGRERRGHLIDEINKLLYALEDNGSTNTNTDNRHKLEIKIIGSLNRNIETYREEMKGSMYPELEVIREENVTAIALDTRNGGGSKLINLRTSNILRPDSLDIVEMQSGTIMPTKDKRSL